MNYENEEWRDIKFTDTDGKEYDYSGLYQVSNYGRVRSLGNDKTRKEKILNLKPNKKRGYINVALWKDGKNKKIGVHRLVAHMFIPNPNNHPIINHQDENPSNNVWTNLEWCKQEYNVNYGTSMKRMSEKSKGKQKTKEMKTKLKGNKNACGKRGKQKAVICIETGQVFKHASEATEWCGISGGISRCCKGKRQMCGGYHWKYYDDYKRELRMKSDINNSKLIA